MINISVDLNWKSFSAIGASLIGLVIVKKMDPNQAKEVSIHAIDACKGVAPMVTKE